MKNIYLIDLKPVNFTFFLRKFGSLFSHSLSKGDFLSFHLHFFPCSLLHHVDKLVEQVL